MTEREKMLAGELYNPLDPELVAARERARELCGALNATRESEHVISSASGCCPVASSRNRSRCS